MASVEPSLAARDPSAPVPLTYAQEVLWLLDRSTRGLTAYNQPHAWRVRGALDIAALERAVCALVARHEALRTVFESREGGAVQVILPAPEALTIAMRDVSLQPPDEREGAAMAELRALSDTPFELDREPGFRVVLARIAAGDHILLIVIHHIVHDYGSRGVMWEELSVLYDAAVRGVAAGLAPVGLQFGDFAAWQRETIRGDRAQERLAHWRTVLADLPTLNLPTDHAPATTPRRAACLAGRPSWPAPGTR